MKKQPALLRIDFEIIQEKKTRAGAQAEADAYDIENFTVDQCGYLETNSLPTTVEDSCSKTKRYVAYVDLCRNAEHFIHKVLV